MDPGDLNPRVFRIQRPPNLEPCLAVEDRDMKKSFSSVAVAVVLAMMAAPVLADSTSTSTGGAGGTGGSAVGGTATGGVATGGTGGTATSGGSAQGGTANASSGASTSAANGGNVGTVSTGASSASLGDVTVNYNVPSSATGKSGLGVGVDPTTGHVVTDNTVSYSGSYKLKNTPDINVGGPASGPCNGFSGGLGFSIAGMSIGGNASTVDENCTARETARVAAMIGRMDIANAVLENLPGVQAALRARAAREAALTGQVGTAPLRSAPGPDADPRMKTSQQVATNAETAVKEAALREQQKAAQEALVRQATMAKVNDTLRFTDATNQNREKTPQQAMAEEAAAKLVANSGDAKAADANPPADAPELQQASKPEEIKTTDGNVASTVPTATHSSVNEDVKKGVSNAGGATLASQQISRLDTQVVTTPLAPAQIVRAESKLSLVDVKSSQSSLTTEERVRAAKAAMNLQ
jgi:hypothetical protein